MKKLSILFISLALLGCATAKSTSSLDYAASSENKLSFTLNKTPGAIVPAEDFQLIKTQIETGLRDSNLLATNQEKSSHSAIVTIQSYRMRDDAARLTVGILAGCDSIRSDVVVIENSLNTELGRSHVSMKECAAWGVANQVIEEYTEGVIDFLTNSGK